MSPIAELVKQVLSALGLDLPWKRMTSGLVIALCLIGYFDRADLTAGITAWIHDGQCHYEQIFAAALTGPDTPKAAVISEPTGCTLKITPTPTTLGSLSRHGTDR